MQGGLLRERIRRMDDPVARLRAGDREAFREIVLAYQARLRALIASYGIPAADVDDLAQDAFIHAYEHLSEFEPGTSLGAWLKAIARFKALGCLEAARRQARNLQGALRAFLQERSRERDEAGEAEGAHRLRECLESLDERHRRIVEQRYAGVPLEAIAREMARTVDAVKMALLRVRQQLRKCVEAKA